MFLTKRKSAKASLSSLFSVSMLVAASAAFTAPGVAFAESEAAAQQEQKTKMVPASQVAAAIKQQLAAIQQEVVAKKPELAKQKDELQKLIKDAMAKKGYSPEKDAKKLQEIQAKAKAKDLSDAQKKALAEEFMKVRQSVAGIREQVLQDPVIKQKSEAYQTALITAMKAENPDTERLLGQMAKLQQLQQKAIEKAREQQQQ